MKARKTYFLVPPGNPPAVGSIVLGDIFTDAALTTATVNKQHLVFPPSIPIVYSSPLKNWKWSKTQGSKTSGGIFAQFTGIVDFELSAMTDKNNVREYFCTELETQSFLVSTDYIDMIKALPEVQSKILQRESLYIVTGIKIAKGVTVNEEAFKSLGFRLATTVDLTALGGAPVKLGPQAEFDRAGSERLKYNIEEDFVFAYRLEEIFYRWRSMRNRPFGKEGELHNVSAEHNAEDAAEDDETEDTIDNFVFDNPQDHETPASMTKGLQTCQLEDVDGEEYQIFW